MIQSLTREYNKEKHKIKRRLKEFKSVWNQSHRRVFSELCFCICTPQSNAAYCDKAISNLEKNGILFRGNLRQLRAGLKGVRFPNNKAKYIIEARKSFIAGKTISIKDKIKVDNIPEARQWLTRHVKGLGFKEASHFLRNIGLGKDIAILDVHILRNLKRRKVIKEIPSSMSKKTYLDIENKMKRFSRKINIPLEELDLLFWSNETGFIFK